MNAFDTLHYQEQRRCFSAVFAPDYLSDRLERTTRLEDGLTVQTRYYNGMPPSCRYQIHASENTLLDGDRKALYRWQNLNDSGDFCRLIHHRNGNRYLVFRCDLYGYSVLELETGRDSHYLPLESEPEKQADFRETFLWTGAEYHRESGLLAVPGCYWACPNGTLLLDFSDPLEEQDWAEWLDIQSVVDPDLDEYDDIDLERFGPDGLLYFKTTSAEDGAPGAFTIPAEQVLRLTKKKKTTYKERG